MTAERHVTVPPRPRGGWSWFADVGGLGLGLALAASSVRLFAGTRPTVVLLVVATAAWVLAVALRRSVPATVAELVHLGIGLVVLLWVVGPEARFGPLPTPASVPALAEVIRDDFARLDEDIAPLTAGAGHLAVLGALVWLLALFCSTTSMRLRAPVQGALPHVAGILGLGIVSRGQGRTAATVALLCAVGLYALSQAAWRNAALRWLPAGHPGVRRPLVAGAGVLGAAGVVVALLAPLSPVTSDPTLDLRRGGLGGGGPRTVVSPFVEVGSNLAQRSDEVLFTVDAPQPAYWRLTSLDTYDPDDGIWVLSNSYAPVEGPLAEASGEGRLDAEVTVRSLGGIWIPAPPAPLAAEAPFALSWDRASGSLISTSDDLATDAEVRIESDAREVTTADLRAGASSDVPDELLDASGAPPELLATASALAAGLSDLEAALALQDWFRSEFAYDEAVDYSRRRDPLGAFLEQRRGFCQQFSTAFALAARSVGLPSRVVVGFTPGDATAPSGDGATFVVRGRHAHAWPEVRFEGVGWVPFEPTPGRGNPTTAAVTGVAPAQAAPPPGSDPTEGLGEQPGSTTTTTAAGTDPTATTTPAGESEVTTPEGGTLAEPPSTGTPWPLVLGVVATGAVVAAVALARRRRTHPPPVTDGVMLAWRRALAALEAEGVQPGPAETPLEFARRAGGQATAPSLPTLAELESRRRWAPGDTRAEDVRRARAAADAVVAELAGARSAGEPGAPAEVVAR